MYIALLLILLGLAAWLILRSLNTGRWSLFTAGVLLAVAGVGFFGLLSFWGELLWFESVGYSGRFWKTLEARAVTASAGALFSALLLVLLTWPGAASFFRGWTAAAGAVIGGFWGLANWSVILRYWNRVPAGLEDPVYGKDAGFYLFTLPLLDGVYGLLMLLGILAGVIALLRLWRAMAAGDGGFKSGRLLPIDHRPLYVAAGFLLLVFAFGNYLNRFHLMYSQLGVVYGPGWTDIHIRLPVYWILIVLCVVTGAAFLIPALRDRIHRVARRPWKRLGPADALAVLTPILAIVAVAVVGVMLVPGLAQWLKVQPSEITLERPYLQDNIRFTRVGFRLHEIEDRQFPVVEQPGIDLAAGNRLVSEVRLWDPQVLQEVYQQFQEIRLYYEFNDVDVDRYRIGDDYRLVMVSAREMDQSNLPAGSQTFVNTRFKYTHGNGITLTPVSEFTADGLPNLLVRDIPPVSEHPDLKVERPEVYYGELTDEQVYANSREPEFDYPSGSENVYTHYAGEGGVELKNWWRKFLFGWKLDGTRFLLSSYPRAETRVMFRRHVMERVRAIAPFLEFDSDPYVVLAGGKLYWFVEGYTTSSQFPYSEPYDRREVIDYAVGETPRRLENRALTHFAGANYVRNSVKAVVDAYDGSVDLYLFEPADPLIRVWDRIFPGVFKPAAEMPPDLRAHVRYPHEFLLIQGLVNAKYHMQDPVVFYNQEDLWTTRHGEVLRAGATRGSLLHHVATAGIRETRIHRHVAIYPQAKAGVDGVDGRLQRRRKLREADQL